MVEKVQRTSLYSSLKGYCHFSGDDGYIEVTEWANGEGYDITVSRKRGPDQHFSLTWGEWKLMQVLMNWEGDG